VPHFVMGCTARWPGGTHDHCCFLGKDHAGRHACYCGVWWSEDGTIKLRRQPPQQ